MTSNFLKSLSLSVKTPPDLLTWLEMIPGFSWNSPGVQGLDQLPQDDLLGVDLSVTERGVDSRSGKSDNTADQASLTELSGPALPWSGYLPWPGVIDAGFDAHPGNGSQGLGGRSGGLDVVGAGLVGAVTHPANPILVQWRQGDGLAASIPQQLHQQFRQGPVEVFRVPQGISAEQELATDPPRHDAALANVDWLVGIQATSNDSFYNSGQLWGMYSSDSPTAAGGTGTTNRFGSQAEQAWAQGHTGSSSTVVGVVDEGIDYTHPDLYLNIWLNPGEISRLDFFSSLADINSDGLITFRDLNHTANSSFVSDVNLNGRIDAGDLLADVRWEDGVDGDGNGRPDDLVGWDFYNNSNDPFRAADGDNHGTHVAGTIGAMGGNGVGVAGVNWDVQLMSLKFLGPDGGYTSDAAAAVNYFANMTLSHDIDFGGKAQYVGTNNSWGGGGYSSTLNNAILNGARAGNLFVAAAGNATRNNDVTPAYPANYSTKSALGWDAVVSVASITSSGSLSGFSNYGASTVDLGAPGSGIQSTVAGGGYARYSGTSMATPHVTGALALMASAYPSATPQQLVEALHAGAAPTASLSGTTVTGGRLDVNASLQALAASQGGGSGTPLPPNSTPLAIWGTTASDTLTGSQGGGSGADQITGVTQFGTAAANLGRGQIDTVTGGAGADLFLLADDRGGFYNDGRSTKSGTGDFLRINDFNPNEDALQILGSSQYLVRNVTINGTAFSEIYLGNDDSILNSRDELVARLQGAPLSGAGATALGNSSGVFLLGGPSWTNVV